MCVCRPHLHDGVHGTGLLAEAAVDALGHVDVVARGSAAAVSARLRLDGDGLGGTHAGQGSPTPVQDQLQGQGPDPPRASGPTAQAGQEATTTL